MSVDSLKARLGRLPKERPELVYDWRTPDAAKLAAMEAAGAFDDIKRRRAERDARVQARLAAEAEENARYWTTPEGQAARRCQRASNREESFWEAVGRPLGGRNSPERWPDFLRELVDSPPPAGEGVHKWLYKLAYNLHAHFPDKDELFQFMRGKADHAGRPVDDREVRGAIDYAADHAWGGRQEVGVRVKRQPTWPQPDLKQIDDLVYNGKGLEHLRSASPIDGSRHSTPWYLKQLFTGDPLLCLGTHANNAATLQLSEWLNKDVTLLSFIVPSEMTAPTGANMQGERTPRSLANTGPRCYLVVEFDFAEFGRDGKTPSVFAPLVRRWRKEGITVKDACATLLWRLHRHLDLAMAVWSGGKSVHGWFPCRGETEEDLRLFMRLAVELGADEHTWVRCQLVRLPGGCRAETGVRQEVYYFDPDTLKT